MPDIHFDCSRCTQAIDAPEELAGQLIECPTCREMIEVPIRTRHAGPPKSPEPTTKPPPAPAEAPAPASLSLAGVEKSGIAELLSIVAFLELGAAPLAGLAFGEDSKFFGWTVFISGLVSGLILLGFGKVIEYLNESAQCLARIESLIGTLAREKKASGKSAPLKTSSPTAK
jgi:hypothetical protein